jgi:hypothetical protein
VEIDKDYDWPKELNAMFESPTAEVVEIFGETVANDAAEASANSDFEWPEPESVKKKGKVNRIA